MISQHTLPCNFLELTGSIEVTPTLHMAKALVSRYLNSALLVVFLQTFPVRLGTGSSVWLETRFKSKNSLLCKQSN